MITKDGVELLDTGEVAERFHVAAKTVSRWGTSERLVSAVTEGRRRYFADEVNARLAGDSPEDARKLGEAAKARLSGGES